MAQPTEAELEELRKRYPNLFPQAAAPAPAAAPPKAAAPKPKPQPRAPSTPAPARAPAPPALPRTATAATPTALPPKQFSAAREDLFTVGGAQSKQKDIARLKARLAEAPDFDTYMQLQREIEAIENQLGPSDVAPAAGVPTLRQGEAGFLGVPGFEVEATRGALNLPGDVGIGDVFRPRVMVGPLVQEEEATTGAVRARGELANRILTDEAIAEAIKGKPAAEAAYITAAYQGQRALIRSIAEANPDLSEDEVIRLAKEELADITLIEKEGKGRLGVTTQEPNAPKGAVQDLIFSRKTTPGSVPNVSPAQIAYYETVFAESRAQREKDAEDALRNRLTEEDIVEPASDITEAEVAAGGTPRMVTRKRTPQEVEQAVRAQLPNELKSLKTPWFVTKERGEILANPEKYATKEPLLYGGRTVYPTGATREGVGAFALRVGMAPLNVVGTALASGAARGAEALARATTDTTGPAPKGAVVEAREKRAEAFPRLKELPEGFVGDLQEAAIMGRGAADFTGDLYEELGLNRTVGTALGLGLDLLAPPFAGVVSASTSGVKAFNAVRAAEAAGLMTGTTARAAARRAAVGAFRDAWTWRNLAPGAVDAVLPGSVRLAAAEETGKVLGFRAALKEAEEAAGRALTDGEIIKVANEHRAAVGMGKWAEDFRAAVRGGPTELRKFTGELMDDAANIPAKGHYLSGSKKLIGESDTLLKAARGGEELAGLSEGQLRTILANAAGRSDDVYRVLAQNPGMAAGGLFKTALGQSPEAAAAIRQAAASTSAYDALAKASGGFRNLKDMVVISPRFIGTSEGAERALRAAADSPIGQGLRRFTDFLLESEKNGEKIIEQVVPEASMRAQGVRVDRPVQAVRVDPASVSAFSRDLNYLFNAGHISNEQYALSASLLTRADGPFMPVSGLRAMAEGNLNDVILRGGFGINVESVKYSSPFKRGGFLERQAVAGETAARERLFTPTQMRSVFDGAAARVKALNSDMDAVRELLDVSPFQKRLIDDFAAKSKQVDADIKALARNLADPQSTKRAAYGLPEGVELSNSDIMSAIARGVSPDEAGKFVDEAVNSMLFGVEARTTTLSSIFAEVTVYSANKDKYFTAAGLEARAGLTSAAKEALVGGAPVLNVLTDLRRGLDTLMQDRAMTSAAWRVEKPSIAAEADMPKVLGASLYVREVENLKDATIMAGVTEDGLRNLFVNYTSISNTLRAVDSELRGYLSVSRNNPAFGAIPEGEDIVRSFIYASMRLDKSGPRTWTDLLQSYTDFRYGAGVGLDEADTVLMAIRARSPDAGNFLDNISPLVNGAADMASTRARLNNVSIEEYIEAFSEAADVGMDIRGTARFVRGSQVQSALETFVREDVRAEVFQAVAAEMVKMKKTPYQRAAAAVWTGLQQMGNVRYNLFLYLRPAYHGVNVMTAPFILHATLGLEDAPLAIAQMKAARAMEGLGQAQARLGGKERLLSGALAGAAGGVAGGVPGMAAGLGLGAAAAAGGKPVGRLLGAADDAIALRDRAGRVFTYGDLRELGVRSGLFKTEQQVLFGQASLDALIAEAQRLERTSGRKIPGTVYEGLRDIGNMPADWANSTDNFWRMSSFIEALSKGKPVTVAQEIAKKSLFDYGSLLPAERAFASRFLIFYTFSRVSAEQVAKSLGSAAGATRFVRQAALSRDVSKMMYEMNGGQDYDLRRFYMTDRQLARVILDQETVGSSEMLRMFPALPSQDSFMQILGVLYARSPGEVFMGTETGMAQFADPGIKYLLEQTDERRTEDKKRADKLRLMDPRHVAIFWDSDSMTAATAVFGELTPISPSKDTSITYLDKEWQLTPEGYRKYKLAEKTASFLGLRSTADYYVQYFGPGEETLQRPGRDRAGGAIGVPMLQAITPEQQEATVLRTQAAAAREREKQRKAEQAAQSGAEVREEAQ